MQAQIFEPMSIGRILDQTFKVYKDNFIRFITIVAIIQIPVSLLVITSNSLLQGSIASRQRAASERPGQSETNGGNTDYEQTGQGEAEPSVMFLGFIGIAIGGVLSILGQVLCNGALTKSVSETYLGNEITVGEAYKFILPKFLTLIGAGILIILAVYAGFILLIVPGIIFGLWFLLTTPAIIVENLKATSGMSRSKALAKGNLGKIFSVAFLIGVISLVINIPFLIAAGLVPRMLFTQNMYLSAFVNQLFSVAGSIMVAPIGSIAYILLYYDLRIRKEGFDLQMLANSFRPAQGPNNPLQP